MRKLLLLFFVILFTIGCETAEDTTEMEDSEEDTTKETTEKTEEVESDSVDTKIEEDEKIDLDSYSTMAQIFALGRSVYCSGSDEISGEVAEYEYWLKKDQMKVQSTYSGFDSTVIVKDDEIYMSIGDQMKDIMDTKDCEWLKSEKDDSMMQESTKSSYQAPEDVEVVDFDCKFTSIADSTFKVSGTVCSMEDLMGDIGPAAGAIPEDVEIPDDVMDQIPDEYKGLLP